MKGLKGRVSVFFFTYLLYYMETNYTCPSTHPYPNKELHLLTGGNWLHQHLLCMLFFLLQPQSVKKIIYKINETFILFASPSGKHRYLPYSDWSSLELSYDHSRSWSECNEQLSSTTLELNANIWNWIWHNASQWLPYFIILVRSVKAD